MCWLQQKFDTATLKPTETEPSFRKFNTPTNYICFSHSSLGQGVMSTKLATLCHHSYTGATLNKIAAGTKMVGAYKVESRAAMIYVCRYVMTYISLDMT